MIVLDQDKPDMWGTTPDSSMHGVPPEGDSYYIDSKHPHFNSEVYWAEREAKFWREMADSFWYATRNGDGDILEVVFNRANLYFGEPDDE